VRSLEEQLDRDPELRQQVDRVAHNAKMHA
jgi:hypothetical protein